MSIELQPFTSHQHATLFSCICHEQFWIVGVSILISNNKTNHHKPHVHKCNVHMHSQQTPLDTACVKNCTSSWSTSPHICVRNWTPSGSKPVCVHGCTIFVLRSSTLSSVLFLFLDTCSVIDPWSPPVWCYQTIQLVPTQKKTVLWYTNS